MKALPKNHWFFLFFITFLLTVARAGTASPRETYQNLPISFEANIGQADPAIQFLAHGQNGNLLFTRDETWLTLRGGTTNAPAHLVRLRLSGANANPTLEGMDLLPGKANYFIGSDSAGWRTDAPTFGKVKYHEVYPGIDLVYYGNQQKLEYDFVLRPGADAGAILLEFSGVDKITADGHGDLLLQIGSDIVRQRKPIVYQEINGIKKMLSGEYLIHSGMRAGFEIADYDRTQPLVIDPVLTYAATFGGSAGNQAQGIALDFNENVYVVGSTTSMDFPLVNAYQTNFQGNQDVFVTKMDTNGTVIYSTYLGGGILNNINQASFGRAIAVNKMGNAYIAGFTEVTNFPVFHALQSTNGGICDAFVTELGTNGNTLVYSTYLGGELIDQANSIALDINGNAVVTGHTQSTHFPTTNAMQSVYGGNGDAFVAKLKSDGSGLIYSTYLGGNDSENNTSKTLIPFLSLATINLGGAVAVDFHGNAFVTGWTYSTNFPVLNAFQTTNNTDEVGFVAVAFLAEYDTNGALVYSTYFGDPGGDYVNAIGVDVNDNVVIAGSDYSGGLPVKNAAQSVFGGRGAGAVGDAFVAAFDYTGTNLIYCTYLGGSGDEQVNGIHVRPDDGAVSVTGFTDSANFPVLNGVQPTGQQTLFKTTDGGNDWSVSNTGLASSTVYSVLANPANPSVVYALTANGCFKSTNAGAGWFSVNNGLGPIFSPLVMQASGSTELALDPQHPDTLYAVSYGGIYKTTDGGANWNFLPLPISSIVQTVAVDPESSSIVYAGQYGQNLYKSIDGGNTWNAVTNGLNNFNISLVAVDPQNSSVLYTAVDNFSGFDLFRSTNGGANWSITSSGFAQGIVTAVAFAPGNSSNVFATVVSSITGNSVFCVSTNGGVSWTQPFESAGFGFTALAIASTSPSPSSPALAIAPSGAQEQLAWPLQFSLQATASLNPPHWTNVTASPTQLNGQNTLLISAAAGQAYYRLIGTNTSAATAPVIYMGTSASSGYGVLESFDNGASWSPAGPPGMAVNSLAVSPNNSAIVYQGVSGGRDAFVTTLTPSGQIYSSTYLGGSGTDQGTAIAGDTLNLFVTGSTLSSDFPTANGPLARAFDQLDGLKKFRISTDSNNVVQYIEVTLDGGQPCPEDSTNYIPRPGQKPLHVGDFLSQGIHFPYSKERTDATATGSVPGVDLNNGSLGSDDNYAELDGTTTEAGTFTVVVHFFADECDWTKTYIVTILP
ncbi:MAG TPA: SBBP repeat-containing protein [Verrucomicrobiae bacterium]|nr:SBBP repeat-containing protein [Verrucomicrobiae bacterium]